MRTLKQRKLQRQQLRLLDQTEASRDFLVNARKKLAEQALVGGALGETRNVLVGGGVKELGKAG